MAHRPRKGEITAMDVDIGRREALTRLGLGVSAAYAAPVLLTLTSTAEAGVVIGDGDLDNHNNKGGKGGGGSSGSSGASGASGASGHGNGNGHGGYIGQNRRRKPEGEGGRMTVRELLEYLANFGKRKAK